MSAGPGAPVAEPLPPLSPPPRRRRSRPARSFPAALGLTVVNGLVPGTGFLVAGRRVLGAVTLVLFVAAGAALAWLALGDRRLLVRLAVDRTSLLGILGV